MRSLLIGVLHAYRMCVSPLYGQVCKFHPSCSWYALEAVRVHGAARGSWLAARRLGRCHPWSAGGYDPVPGTPAADAWQAELAQMRKERQKYGAGVVITAAAETAKSEGSA